PKRSLGLYAQTNFLFGICVPVSRLQWSPIAPSKREHICSKIEVVIIITLMTDLGLSGTLAKGKVICLCEYAQMATRVRACAAEHPGMENCYEKRAHLSAHPFWNIMDTVL
ncbi:MAG: hypothetical protein ACI36X_03125, partial [Bacteroidaceae bacterium]